jgi:ankyrin repeat protein
MGKNSALCQAVVSGTARQVKKLIDEGADINGIEVAESRTPLTAAIDHGKTDIALLLLQLGADPTARPKKNWKPESPLHLAAQRGNLDVVRELIARGVNVNAVITPHNGFAGRTPLMNAADGGQLEVVRFLIEHGADVSARDQRGNTALTAAENKEVRAYLAELLAQRPLDTRPGDLAGAVRDGLTDRVTALLDAGMAADDVDSFGASALMVAVEKGDVTMASLLLDRGANANFLSANGWLPITTFGIKPKMINLLLERGADPNAAMGDDATVLSWAFGSGSKQLVQALLDAGGKLELDEAQKKELLEEARGQNRSVVPLLLQHLGTAADEVDKVRARVKEFVRLAEADKFQATAKHIGTLFGRAPAPWKRRKGVVYYHNVSVVKHLSRHYDEPAGDLTDPNQAWRLFARYSKEVLQEGYTLIMNEALAESGRYPVLLFPTADKYAVLAAVGTNGVNYGHDTDAVIRWFLETEKTWPFTLVDAGHDFVGGQFTGKIAKPRALVERMLEFCPDIRNFADADIKAWSDKEVIEALVSDLKEGGSFAFWWD